jgi:hypothetical protein
MRRLVLLAVAMLVGLPAQAQERAQLTVILTDTLARPVVGVRVAVNGLGLSEPSDSSGVVQITGIPLGSRMVSIDHPGYRHEDALVQFPSANNFRLRVTLTPSSIALDTIKVGGRRFNLALHQNGFYRREREGLGRFMGREKLDEIVRGSPDLAPAFDQMLGIRVDRAPSTGFVLRSSRGAASFSGLCTPAVRIDGLRADSEQLSMLSPSMVEAIEVFASPGTVPGEYGDMDTTCGLVLVWLRR